MGSDPDEPYFWGAEAPKHPVHLDAFWIYQTEVTNSMYRACVEQGKCATPQEVSSHTHEDYYNNPEFDGYPVIHVTYEDGLTYCDWAGARLPTEAEWEKAARGEEGALFPGGNDELGNDLANFCDEGCPGHSEEFTEFGFNDGYRDVAPVGSYPAGASPFGALDMAGNVLEWVADWYAVDYYSLSPHENPTGPESGTRHIIRGGSWWSLREGLRPSARASKSLDYSSDMVGFRCAVVAP
jgi:formylglycine-generating enzyme required for sulfatase activity